MTTIKKIPKEKVAVLHVCEQRENISKMNLILLGNGNPKEGLAYKVIKMADDIEIIKTGVQELAKNNGLAIETATTALHAIETYKKEMDGIEKGKEEYVKTKVEKRADLQKNLQFIATMIMVLGLLFTAYFGFRTRQESVAIKTRVDDLGVPVVTRGNKIMNLPEDTQIKFFLKDFKDTIK